MGLGRPLHNGKVPLVDFPILDLLIHHPQGFRRLGGDHDAPGVPVNAVAQRRGEGVFLPGTPLPLLVQVRLDVVDQGAAIFRAVVGMHRKARALVHKQNVFVLVDNVQIGIRHGEVGVVLPGVVKKLVVDIQLQDIALLQPGVPVDALAVALDALDADIFLRQRGRKQRDCLRKKTIQTLPRVVLADGKLFHVFLPMFSSKCWLTCSVNSSAAL